MNDILTITYAPDDCDRIRKAICTTKVFLNPKYVLYNRPDVPTWNRLASHYNFSARELRNDREDDIANALIGESWYMTDVTRLTVYKVILLQHLFAQWIFTSDKFRQSYIQLIFTSPDNDSRFIFSRIGNVF